MGGINILSPTLPMSGKNESQKIIDEVAFLEGFQVSGVSSLAGGSINEVFLLKTNAGKKVLKLNEASKFPGMFQAEKEGLETLRDSQTIDVPEVFTYGISGEHAYLLLEYKPEGNPPREFWHIFSRNLAALHKNTTPNFGFSSSNYIGSLRQYNERSGSASEFYISQRLEPQLKLALEKGFSFGNLESVFKNIAEAIPKEAPALIHGDLWSGNYLVTQKGQPCLIDPAVCFAPREMDLAMMKLFGGFPEVIFLEYNEIFPLEPGFENRIPLWQLYYLLVHLNIFGSSYFSSVKNIFTAYS